MNMRSTAAPEETETLPPGGAAYLTWSPEQMAIGFRSLEKINPVHVVRHGTHVRLLPKADQQISPSWNWKGQEMTVDRYMDTYRSSGSIVLKDGKVVLERYGLGRTEKDAWLLTSATKCYTATLVGAAIKDGYIKSVDALVTDYIPALKGSAYDNVTIRHLLTFTSGVRWIEDVEGDYTHPDANFLSYWAPVLDTDVDCIVSYMRRLPRANPPGTMYNYTDGDAHLAGIVISSAVGKPLSEYLSEKIWQPYGMEADAYWQLDASGNEQAGGFLSVTLRDQVRFGQFILEGGKAGAVQVVPPDFLAAATSVQVNFVPGASSDGPLGKGFINWSIYKDYYVGSGGAGQRIFVYPKDKVVIAINSAWPYVNRFAAAPDQKTAVLPVSDHEPALNAFAEALRAAAVSQR
ncbi:beta-lactamase family protein [Mesorhizobium sp. NZP2077]|uniref:serine hydrolase domain-containing protein n=1 Tax=Mesorhizobium sp. NZP2077 TaxID=2483404 RepID=UPI001552EF45|nr:serine hydrolase [Mesorhizobium sp. NZP2077]QKD19623.1 beta-lactamase family protein [Mesorhizobium sp. NZP2077]